MLNRPACLPLPPCRLRTLCVLAFATTLAAQTAPAPTAPSAPLAPAPTVSPATSTSSASSTDPAGEEAIQLSPFEVHPNTDVGYQAGNTTSGSRLDSKLKDTPGSISPFTAEFLSDIAATNLEEMLDYAINVEDGVSDASNGFDNGADRDAGGGDHAFRIRGIIGGASRDFVDSTAPTDTYNIERAEVSSGANSILFGSGPGGGLVSLKGKRATFGRARTTLKTQFTSEDSQRYEVDYNKVLIPQRVSLRLLGLRQESETWRKWEFNDQKRFTGALAVKPFAKTSINASFERGMTDNSLGYGQNAADAYLLWNEVGRPVAEGAPVPGTTRFNAVNNFFIFFEQDATVFNHKGELLSAPLNALDGSGRPRGVSLVPPDIVPYRFNIGGPGGFRHQDFESYQVQLEQRFTRDFVVELALFHNEADVSATSPQFRRGGIALGGDPNAFLPNPAGVGAPVRNERGGQLYMESQFIEDRRLTENDVARLTASYELDFGRWFGRHRLAGLLEDSKQEILRRNKEEILVDQNNLPITTAQPNPENANNKLFRRRYLVEGDFDTYYTAVGDVAVPTYTFEGRQITSTYVARRGSNSHTVKDVETAMLASQSFWFKERLVTTLGYRIDDISFRDDTDNRVTDPNDPRVVSRQLVLNEYDFDGGSKTRRYKPKTFTAGGVVHATKRFSAFYNFSKNTGTPRFDRTVLPTGEVPAPTEGQTRDYGVMLDLFGDDRYFLRATQFNTEQIGDASIVPDGIFQLTSTDLGGTNLIDVIDLLLGANRITQAQYDAQNIAYNAATIDLSSEGQELEFVANPTPGITLRLGYSHSKRRPSNLFKEVFAFYGQRFPEWRAQAAGDPTLLAAIETEIGDIENKLESLREQHDSPFASRPHKGVFTGRYTFREGRLKGLAIGGGLRYQSANFSSVDRATGQSYYGNETLFGDAFATYRTRLPGLNIPLTLQLNVKNISNSYQVSFARYNNAFDGARRVYLNDPRSYRFTTTLEF